MTVRLLERIHPVVDPEVFFEECPWVKRIVLPREGEDEIDEITFMARILDEEGKEALYVGTDETYLRYVRACAMDLECKGVN